MRGSKMFIKGPIRAREEDRTEEEEATEKKSKTVKPAMSTFAHEHTRPALPLPPVAATVAHALAALRPLVPDAAYAALTKEGDAFLASPVSTHLQTLLKDTYSQNANPSNVYGDLRGQTLPRNPFFILEDDPLKVVAPSMEYRAAVLTISTLRFILALQLQKLRPDVHPRTLEPLSMAAYHHLFGTCVVPDATLGVTMKKATVDEARHIVLMAHGHFYALTVLAENNQIWFSKHELSAIIKQIIAHSKSPAVTANCGKPSPHIGTFTSETKDTWRAARLSLERSNPQQMHLIDSALFILSLDDEDEEGTVDDKIQRVPHGTSRIDRNGVQYGTCINRFYDKLNLVVTKNATAACIYPASIIDGTTVLRFVGDIYTDSVLRMARMINNGKNYTLWSEINTVPINSEIVKPSFSHIKFNLNNELSNGLHLAESRLADIINQHDYVAKKLPLGKNYIKNKMKLPTDSFVQICIQITYFALYGKNPATFEPVSTRRFQNARTEPICIQNETLVQLCQAFISQTSDVTKWELFAKALQIHQHSVLMAANGEGFERHLSALRATFINEKKVKSNLETPPFLFNPLLESIYKPELIVANCGNPALDYFGITPSIPSGFGFGYIIKDESITIVGSSQWRQTDRFLETLDRVVSHIKQIWKKIILHPNSSSSRDDDLQKYISSIPMSLIQSNNSSVHPTASTSTTTSADAYILGGYDYFDVGEVYSRSKSELVSRAQSRTISRVASQVNININPSTSTSFKNIGQLRESAATPVGRLLTLQPDI